ncbi:hypothetical protein PR048_008277 [Dryococelus australis]|uniref:HAT C-terminal dimerisation domain-containing protein n=1 Tax=Dryococelus australis TaxID=614101 RepID=A0ABQ9HWR5_9NEOP|nr:hypothetical protein PR048_008277 [Dryococelus australis]
MQSEKPQIHLLHAVMPSTVRTLLSRCESKCAVGEMHRQVNKRSTLWLPNSLFRFFFIETASQIYKRFQFENTVLKEREVLDRKYFLKKKIPSIAHLASKFPAIVTYDRLQSLDMEWQLLRNHKFDFDENVSAEEFWFHVKKLNAGDGSPMFPHLISFVEDLLCLPHSSANVERIFSAVNMIKTKQRNSLSTDTLVGLLHTKRMLKNSKCFDFPISSELVNKMIASMYDAD